MLRVITAPAPRPGQEMTPLLAQKTWLAFAAREPEFRASAAEHFPSDEWSQDDDFFASERGWVISWAERHDVRRQAVFAAIDQGLRQRWPLPPSVPWPSAQVAPCSPRAIE